MGEKTLNFKVEAEMLEAVAVISSPPNHNVLISLLMLMLRKIAQLALTRAGTNMEEMH